MATANFTTGADSAWNFALMNPHDWADKKEEPDKSPGELAAAAAGAEATRLVRAGETAVGAASTAAAQNLQTISGDLNLAAAQSNADLNVARSAGAALTETAGQ